MTYAELIKKLSEMPNERLNDSALIFIQSDSEYVPVKSIWFADSENDVLDENHCYLVI